MKKRKKMKSLLGKVAGRIECSFSVTVSGKNQGNKDKLYSRDLQRGRKSSRNQKRRKKKKLKSM